MRSKSIKKITDISRSERSSSFYLHSFLVWKGTKTALLGKKMVIFYVYSKSFQSEYQLTTVSVCKWTSKLCQRVQQSFEYLILSFWSFPCGLAVKTSACNAGELGSIPGLGRSPGEGKGNLLQYSGLENYMHWIVHGVTKSQTQLSDFHFHKSMISKKVEYSKKRKVSCMHFLYFIFNHWWNLNL